MFYILDIDGTVVCSLHRKLTRADGSLDLEHWVENCTAEKIAQDTLLPLAETMRKAYYSGIHTVIVCTARVLSDADYSFFLEHNLPYHFMLDRPEGCNMADSDLKDIQLRIFAHNQGISWAKFASQSVCFDDNHSVLDRMKLSGIAAVDATVLNRTMANG